MGTIGCWLEATAPARVPLAAWLSLPEASASDLGVVIVPPAGYEHSTSYRAWRLLAERLAASGVIAIRVDPYGTGDSPGEAADLSSLEPWREAFSRGAEELRELGCSKIALVGCRLAGSVGILEASSLRTAGVVALSPVLAGRRYVRQLRMLGHLVPGDSGDLAVAGTYFSAPLLNAIGELSLETALLTRTPLLVVTPPPGQAELELVEAARAAGIPAEALVTSALDELLERPAEEATVDEALVEHVADWLVGLDEHPRSRPVPHCRLSHRARIAKGSETIEEFARVGSDGLWCLLTRVGASAPSDLLVFLNSGSDPHTGPARAWVDFARALASEQLAVARVDFRSWGESSDGPSVPGRPYDAHAVADAEALVAAFKDAGWSRVFLAGLCAGAWIALDVARRAPLDAVIALNPQMYWEPGDPVEALIATTRARREPEIAAFEAGRVEGRWDAEDCAGLRPYAGQWLDELAARGLPITLVFAEGDDGIKFLRDRLARRLEEAEQTGTIRVVEIPEIDHGMHRAWLRPRMLEVLAASLFRSATAGGDPKLSAAERARVAVRMSADASPSEAAFESEPSLK